MRLRRKSKRLSEGVKREQTVQDHELITVAGRCYSPRTMAQDQPVKALVIALTDHAAAAVYSINRLQPDSLCFVLPEGAKSLRRIRGPAEDRAHA